MKEYVLGFMFSVDKTSVALIEKSKPVWQQGKFNGIGGKIEDTDSSYEDAMIREFKEETGVLCTEWREVGVMQGVDWAVHVFSAFTNDVYMVETKEVEEVTTLDTIWGWEEICEGSLSNVPWLIQFCLDSGVPYFKVEY